MNWNQSLVSNCRCFLQNLSTLPESITAPPGVTSWTRYFAGSSQVEELWANLWGDHLLKTGIQGDTSSWAKSPVVIKTKVPFWPRLAWPRQAKTELLFWYQREVWLNPMCHPVHTFLVFTGFSGISDSTFCWLQITKLCIREELQVAPLVAF